MFALLLDVENLVHRSFVAEAYRTAERAHGSPPSVCIAAGSAIHIEQTREIALRLGVDLIVTKFGEKNAADRALVSAAKQIVASGIRSIVIGSGDRGFLKWLRDIQGDGVRLECVARTHQLCKEADSSYDAVYRMDVKAMNLPTASDLRAAVIDCIPHIRTGPVAIDAATSMLRSFRIAPRNTAGRVFFERHSSVFRLVNDGRDLELL